ncbi:MAG: UvrB/UvrC motif-containing protein, partial [Candidatus Heimdallarchaeota archaeon]
IQKSLENITDGLLKIETISSRKVKELATMEESDLVLVLMELKDQMREAAQKLEFEKAADLRDLIREIEGNN